MNARTARLLRRMAANSNRGGQSFRAYLRGLKRAWRRIPRPRRASDRRRAQARLDAVRP